MNFADQLKQLPAIAHVAAIELLDASGQVLDRIHNQPGKAGSVAVYHALAQQHGGVITPAAAAQGLALFCEHTAAARAHPGSHPNIDRLLAWAEGTASHAVRVVSA
ncbi:DUF2322 family protein [Hydrogenophaga defluvii]|uniref:DUF2322 family protein n=1 Tax=Hydrogenophaga defluvii TaxID=249410 RepID=A0ABW2SI98_9BURK